MSFYKDCFILMSAYNGLSSYELRALCISFRDRYHLTDLETLEIARGAMSPTKILEIGAREAK